MWAMNPPRHCERSEAIQILDAAGMIASQSLLSGVHSRDPLVRNDGKLERATRAPPPYARYDSAQAPSVPALRHFLLQGDLGRLGAHHLVECRLKAASRFGCNLKCRAGVRRFPSENSVSSRRCSKITTSFGFKAEKRFPTSGGLQLPVVVSRLPAEALLLLEIGHGVAVRHGGHGKDLLHLFRGCR